MKRHPSSNGYRTAARALLLGICCLVSGSAAAQELLKNPRFESPLGTTNWTVGYLRGTAEDFELKDRSTVVKGGVSNYFGVVFRPLHNKLAHAYFGQTVTNLTAGHLYTLSIWMKEDWWSNPNDSSQRDKFLVYAEVIGGQGDATRDGRASVLATTTPDANIDPPYTYPTSSWRQFTVQQMPDAQGKIEIRLHFDKLGWVTTDKLTVMNGYFDECSLTF